MRPFIPVRCVCECVISWREWILCLCASRRDSVCITIFTFDGVWWMYFNSNEKKKSNEEISKSSSSGCGIQQKKSVVFSSSFSFPSSTLFVRFYFFRSSVSGRRSSQSMCVLGFILYYFITTFADIGFVFTVDFIFRKAIADLGLMCR